MGLLTQVKTDETLNQEAIKEAITGSILDIDNLLEEGEDSELVYDFFINVNNTKAFT